MTATEYLSIVRERFAEKADPALALRQMAYMKDKAVFLGLKMPTWSAATKQIFLDYPVPTGQLLLDVIELCFDQEYREIQYFAIELAQKNLKKQGPEFINTLEFMILTNSWWDTVDMLAKLIGIHFLQHPQLTLPTTEHWMDSQQLWLQRVSIIFQLHYKHKTDEPLMFRYIERVAHSKEFFLQKAAGWALRHHSRIRPDAVREFVETHQLAPLTKREALRLMA